MTQLDYCTYDLFNYFFHNGVRDATHKNDCVGKGSRRSLAPLKFVNVYFFVGSTLLLSKHTLDNI